MWIDTHTHFDAPVFDETRASDWATAQSLGVSAQIMMGVAPFNFAKLAQLADEFSGTFFTLGIHPLYITSLDLPTAITTLTKAIEQHRHNPRFLGIGEIGLDGFVDNVDWDTQVDFFTAQLKLARDYDLPVFMHVRKAQDHVLKYTKRFHIQRGVAHAFNGSQQQAEHYIKQGLKLGFGGALTFERAKNLRRLVKNLPLTAMLLETDSPDMSPAWAYQQSNYSYHLPKIAEVFARQRGVAPHVVAQQLQKNLESIAPNIHHRIDKSTYPPTL